MAAAREAGQLPDGLVVSVVDFHEFTRAPARCLRTVRESGYVVVINGRVGHVAPVGYLTPDCPPELATALPGMLAGIAEAKHERASQAARERLARRRSQGQ